MLLRDTLPSSIMAEEQESEINMRKDKYQCVLSKEKIGMDLLRRINIGKLVGQPGTAKNVETQDLNNLIFSVPTSILSPCVALGKITESHNLLSFGCKFSNDWYRNVENSSEKRYWVPSSTAY